MMAGELDVEYMSAILAALDRLREEATVVETSYLERLGRMYPDASPGNADESVARSAGRTQWVAAAWKRAIGAARFWARAAVLLPGFLAQRAILSRAGADGTPTCLVVAIASNRIPLGGRPAGVRDCLASIMHPLREDPELDIARKVDAAGTIVLFDPLPVSSLWGFRRDLWQENCLIVDGAFLYFLVACKLLAHPLRGAKAIAAVIRGARSPAHSAAPGNAVRLVFFSLVAGACDRVLASFRSVEALFLSSNSMLIEILRAFLLRNTKCDRMYELMHGIGSLPVGRFFSAVVAAAGTHGAYEKHAFVPQIPGLPLHEIFDARVRFAPRLAVNAFLNRYLLERGSAKEAEAFILGECRSLGVDPGTSPMILTVLGNVPNVGGLTESVSFRTECMLIDLVLDLKKSIASELIVVYVPHPAHPVGPFSAHFHRRGVVQVYRSSVLCWMVSDLCMGLLSSALFEAAYFGVRSFAPLVESDRFYSPGYLDLLAHPLSDSREALARSLEQFLSAQDRVPRVPVGDRVRQRLARARHEAP